MQLVSFRSSLAVYMDSKRVLTTSCCCTHTVHTREKEEDEVRGGGEGAHSINLAGITNQSHIVRTCLAT